MTDDFGSTLASTLTLASCCALSSSKLDFRFLVVDFVLGADSMGDLIDLAGLTGVEVLLGFSSIRCRAPASTLLATDLCGDDVDFVELLETAPDRLSAFWCRSFDTL